MFHPSCFVLEALEPRRFLNASILENAGVAEDRTRVAPQVILPATIHQQASARNLSEYGYEDNYRLQVNPNAVYEIHYLPQSTGNTDEAYEISLCGNYHFVWNEGTLRWRFGREQNCYLSMYSNAQVDYSVEIKSIADDVTTGLARALPLIPGTISSQLTGPEQFDYYKFSAIAGSRYMFKAQSPTPYNMTLYIRDNTGAMLTTDDWTTENLDWLAQTTGDYYLEVGGFNASNYDLTMDAYIDDQANQPAPIPSSGIIHGTIDHSRDSDYFTFDAKPGNVYLFHAASNADPSLSLQLLTADGQSSPFQSAMLVRQHTFSRSDFDSIAWGPSQAGTYQLRITGPERDDNNPAGFGEYSIIAESFPLSALPADAPLLPPGPIQVTVAPDSQNWFSFQAVSGSLYSFFTPYAEPEGHFFQIFSSDGTELTNSNDAIYDGAMIGALQWIAPSTGTFFIRAAHPKTGTYTLKMKEQLDDQLGQPVDLTLPATITGRIDYSIRHLEGDADLFSFSATASTTYTVLPLDNSDVDLNILDRNLVPLKFAHRNWFSGAYRWTAPSTGIYYLEVVGERHRASRATGPYSISFVQAPDPIESDSAIDEEDLPPAPNLPPDDPPSPGQLEEESDESFPDDWAFYTDDLYVNDSDATDSDLSPDDSSADWLDDSADPLDSFSADDLWP